jgi:UDP-glucuronate decarboxylase
MTTVLVTGGAGFLGSHLCDRLIERGDDVICVDNFFTGSKENVRHLIGHPRFELIRHDIVHPLYVEADRIFNLACPASPEAYQYNPIKTIKTSTVGMVNIMGLAKRCGARVLHASTSEVYGDPLVHPQTEDYWGHVNPIGPRACYNEGKRAAETLAMDYARHHGVGVKIVRLFNTYGPGMTPGDGRVVPAFIQDALSGDPLLIHGDGSQTRSFCYVTDVVEALIRMMDTPPAVMGPINVGNPHEITMRDLAELIRVKTGSCSVVEFMDRPVDDPERRRPDIGRARALLDWVPTTDLDAGMDQTISYFRRLKRTSESRRSGAATTPHSLDTTRLFRLGRH